MTFYKFGPSRMTPDTRFTSESSCYMPLSCDMVSPFTYSSLSSFALSLELSIILNLVIAGLSILSLVSLLIILA